MPIRFMPITFWLMRLYEKGLIGPGKEIESNLPFEKMGTIEFANALISSIVNLADIGADLALGLQPCAEKWGRWKKIRLLACCLFFSTAMGIITIRALRLTGVFASILPIAISTATIWTSCYWTPSQNYAQGREPDVSAARLAEIMGKKLVPFCDPEMIDYSDEGIYKAVRKGGSLDYLLQPFMEKHGRFVRLGVD